MCNSVTRFKRITADKRGIFTKIEIIIIQLKREKSETTCQIHHPFLSTDDEAPPDGKILFKKPAKRSSSDKFQGITASSSKKKKSDRGDKEEEEDEEKKQKEVNTGKKVKNNSLLSFGGDEEEEED